MWWNLCRDTLYSLRFFVGLVFFSWFSARINRLNYATMAPYSRLHIYLFLSKWYRCHVSPDMHQKHPSKNRRIINRPFAPVIPLQNHRTAKAGRGLQRPSGPKTLLKLDHPKLVVQDRVQTAFECPQGWKIHNRPGQPVLSHPHNETVFPNIQTEFLWEE